MIHRRTLFVGLTAAAAAAAVAAKGTAQDARPAPYRAGRRILADAVPNIDHGARDATDIAGAVHSSFPQIIEQNFARLGKAPFERMFVELSDLELQTLGVVYTQACMQSGRETRLFDLFAERLDADRLARVARHFGAEPMWSAVNRSVPHKTQAFSQALAARGSEASGWGAGVPDALAGPTIDYTIHEIYLSYRTAPIGSLSVKAALYESAMFVGKRLVPAWGLGYAVGSALAPLVQTYAPGLWDGIGGAVHTVVESLSQATNWQTQAPIQMGAAHTFGLTSFETMMLGGTGGDYLVVHAWYQISGGGAGRCDATEWCPPWQPYITSVN